jgi:recombination associated protein RdgC
LYGGRSAACSKKRSAAVALAMTWKGRVSFVLTDSLQIKKLSVDDGLFDAGSARGGDEGFDADAAIATGELRQLIPDLVGALDGELAPA